MNRKTMMVIGALGVIIGSVTPWVVATSIFGTMQMNGIEGDGKFTLVLGLFLLGITTVVNKSFWRITGILVSIGTGVLAVIEILNVSGALDATDYFIGSIGFGLWVLVIGVVIYLIGIFQSQSQAEGQE